MKQSKPDKPITKQQAPDANQNTHGDKKFPKYNIDNIGSQKNKNQPYNLGHTTRYEYFNLIVLIGILIVTTIYAIFAGLQWQIGEKQWTTLENQLRETTAQFHSSHRPWCGFSRAIDTIKPVSFDSGKVTFSVSYTVKNSGNAPALKVNTISAIRLAPMQQHLQYAKQQITDIGIATDMTKLFGNIILPGDIIKVTTEVSKPVNIVNIQSTKIVVMLILSIIYRDEFDNVHYTTERWQYIGNERNIEYFPSKDIKGHWVPFIMGSIAK